MVSPTTYRRIYRASAWYDLLVTAPFATPVTLAFVWTHLMWANTALGGGPVPELGVFGVLFANFFGTVVLIWSVVRLHLDRSLLGRYDAVGRVAFSIWMLVALSSGNAPVLWLFLTVEIAWGLIQMLPVGTSVANSDPA